MSDLGRGHCCILQLSCHLSQRFLLCLLFGPQRELEGLRSFRVALGDAGGQFCCLLTAFGSGHCACLCVDPTGRLRSPCDRGLFFTRCRQKQFVDLSRLDIVNVSFRSQIDDIVIFLSLQLQRLPGCCHLLQIRVIDFRSALPLEDRESSIDALCILIEGKGIQADDEVVRCHLTSSHLFNACGRVGAGGIQNIAVRDGPADVSREVICSRLGPGYGSGAVAVLHRAVSVDPARESADALVGPGSVCSHITCAVAVSDLAVGVACDAAGIDVRCVVGECVGDIRCVHAADDPAALLQGSDDTAGAVTVGVFYRSAVQTVLNGTIAVGDNAAQIHVTGHLSDHGQVLHRSAGRHTADQSDTSGKSADGMALAIQGPGILRAVGSNACPAFAVQIDIVAQACGQVRASAVDLIAQPCQIFTAGDDIGILCRSGSLLRLGLCLTVPGFSGPDHFDFDGRIAGHSERTVLGDVICLFDFVGESLSLRQLVTTVLICCHCSGIRVSYSDLGVLRVSSEADLRGLQSSHIGLGDCDGLFRPFNGNGSCLVFVSELRDSIVIASRRQLILTRRLGRDRRSILEDLYLRSFRKIEVHRIEGGDHKVLQADTIGCIFVILTGIFDRDRISCGNVRPVSGPVVLAVDLLQFGRPVGDGHPVGSRCAHPGPVVKGKAGVRAELDGDRSELIVPVVGRLQVVAFIAVDTLIRIVFVIGR